MAAFAWLLLVALPVHGALPAMNGGTQAMDQGMGAMSSMSMTTPSTISPSTGHDQHIASAKVQTGTEDCCGGDGKHGGVSTCHCASTASSAMATVGMIELSPMLPSDIHSTLRHAMALDIAHGPPLRPPAV